MFAVRRFFQKKALPVWLVVVLHAVTVFFDRWSSIEFVWNKLPVIGTAANFIWDYLVVSPIGAFLVPITGLLVLFIITKPRTQDLLRQEKRQPIITWSVLVQKQHESLQNTDFWYAMDSITHNSESVPKNCTVQLNYLLRLPYNEPLNDFSPIILKWEGHSRKDGEKPLDFNNGQTRRFNLCVSPPDRPRKQSGLQFVIASDMMPRIRINYEAGQYLARVRLLGDNLEPVDQWFKISVEENPSTLTAALSTNPDMS